jgi:hypothetical protein
MFERVDVLPDVVLRNRLQFGLSERQRSSSRRNDRQRMENRSNSASKSAVPRRCFELVELSEPDDEGPAFDGRLE